MIGWRTPELRMEAVSSSRAAGLNAFRGWRGLGLRLSTGSSRSRGASSVSAGEAGVVGDGSRAPRPRPSARFIMGEHLLGQLEIGYRADRA